MFACSAVQIIRVRELCADGDVLLWFTRMTLRVLPINPVKGLEPGSEATYAMKWYFDKHPLQLTRLPENACTASVVSGLDVSIRIF